MSPFGQPFFRMIPNDYVTLQYLYIVIKILYHLCPKNQTLLTLPRVFIVVNNINVVGLLCIILVNNIVRAVPKKSRSRFLKMEKNRSSFGRQCIVPNV